MDKFHEGRRRALFFLFLALDVCTLGASLMTWKATCYDTPNWASGIDCASSGATAADGCLAEGWNCTAYKSKGWCSGGQAVSGHESMVGVDNNYPENNCCECGGKFAPSVQDALNALKDTETQQTNIENAMTSLFEELSKAEAALVEASGNASQARLSIRLLRNKTMTTNLELANFSRETARLKAGLVQTGLDANLMVGTTESLVNHTNNTMEDSQELANPTLLNNLEAMNNRIWEASDISGENSIAETEKEVSDLVANATEVESEIGKKVRTLLVKRFKRGGDGLRAAVKELGQLQATSLLQLEELQDWKI